MMTACGYNYYTVNELDDILFKLKFEKTLKNAFLGFQFNILKGKFGGFSQKKCALYIKMVKRGRK